MGEIYAEKFVLIFKIIFMKKFFLMLLMILLPNIANAVEYSREYTIYQWPGDSVQIRTATYTPDEITTNGQTAEVFCYRTMYEVMEMKLANRDYWEKANLSGTFYRNADFSGEIKNPENILPNRGCLCEINHIYNPEKKICEIQKVISENPKNTIPVLENKNFWKIFRGMQMEMRPTSMGEVSENNKNLQIFLKEMWYFQADIDGKMSIFVLGALRKYQFDNNLIQTGRSDIRTQQVMIRDIEKLLSQ